MTEFRLPADADENSAALVALARAMLCASQEDVDAILRTTDPHGLAIASAQLLIASLRVTVADDPQAVDDALARIQANWMRIQAGGHLDTE